MSLAQPQKTASGATPFPMPRADLRSRLLARLLERSDPAKARHKPPSLFRAELLRNAEQFLAVEAAALTPEQRQSLLAEVLEELRGIGPLDELFLDSNVTEFLILAHNQVIRRQGEAWLPTSVQFRDREHLRQTIKRLFAGAAPIGAAPSTSDGAADAVLPNGFRMIAIIPPRVMEAPCMAVFRREVVPPAAADAAATPMPGSVDPWERLRLRVSEQIAERLAVNGVHNLLMIPPVELRRIIAAYVQEFNELDQLHLDQAGQEKLTLAILSHIQPGGKD